MIREMDPALTVVISAALGGVVAASGGWLRQRYGARTAARLVYAELTRNTAPILYYKQTGVWPANPMIDSAWTDSSKDLARAGDADAFDTMYRGYAAFPALDYVLSDSRIGGQHRDVLVDRAIDDIIAALETAGRIARIRQGKVQDRVARMRARPVSEGTAQGSMILGRPEAVVPAALLEEIAERGTGGQQSWAQSTIASTTAVKAIRFRRAVLDAHGGEDLSAATLVRGEDDGPTGDDAVDEAFDALGLTARFYHEVFGYEFANARDQPLTAVVHYGDNFANCFWDGSRIVAGDGDGQLFGRFTSALDVIAHELSHGVLGDIGLAYEGQAGALLESLCDVFGVMTKQYTLDQASAADADWLLGDGLLITGGALRSLAAPGTAYDDPVLGQDQQPSHMDGYIADASPIVNSGIANHAFFLAATALSGPAWESAGRVWYTAAMSGRLRPKSGFAAFGGVTVAECRKLLGEGPELAAIQDAWRQVGVKPRAPSRQTGSPAKPSV
jgi:hypothetical protein